MGDQEDDAPVVGELPHQGDDLLAGLGVEAAGGLVQEEDLGGAREQLLAQVDALALAARDAALHRVADAGAADVLDVELAQDPLYRALHIAPGHVRAVAQAPGIEEALLDRELCVDHVFLGHDAHDGAVAGEDRVEVLPVHEHNTRVGGCDAGDGVEQGGLARPRGADHGDDLSGEDGEGHIVEEADVADVARDVADGQGREGVGAEDRQRLAPRVEAQGVGTHSERVTSRQGRRLHGAAVEQGGATAGEIDDAPALWGAEQLGVAVGYLRIRQAHVRGVAPADDIAFFGELVGEVSCGVAHVVLAKERSHQHLVDAQLTRRGGEATDLMVVDDPVHGRHREEGVQEQQGLLGAVLAGEGGQVHLFGHGHAKGLLLGRAEAGAKGAQLVRRDGGSCLGGEAQVEEDVDLLGVQLAAGLDGGLHGLSGLGADLGGH